MYLIHRCATHVSLLGFDDDRIHTSWTTTRGIAPKGNGAGREGPHKKAEGRIRRHQIRAGIGKGSQPRGFRGDTHVIGDIQGHGVIDCKAEEGGRSCRFVIIRRSDICGSLYAGRDRGKGIGAVNIHGASGLKARGGHDVRFSTGHRQIGNTEC